MGILNKPKASSKKPATPKEVAPKKAKEGFVKLQVLGENVDGMQINGNGVIYVVADGIVEVPSEIAERLAKYPEYKQL